MSHCTTPFCLRNGRILASDLGAGLSSRWMRDVTTGEQQQSFSLNSFAFKSCLPYANKQCPFVFHLIPQHRVWDLILWTIALYMYLLWRKYSKDMFYNFRNTGWKRTLESRKYSEEDGHNPKLCSNVWQVVRKIVVKFIFFGGCKKRNHRLRLFQNVGRETFIRKVVLSKQLLEERQNLCLFHIRMQNQ